MSSSEEGKKGYHQAEGKRGHQLKKTIEGKRGHHQGQEGHHQVEDVPAGHQKSWKRKKGRHQGKQKRGKERWTTKNRDGKKGNHEGEREERGKIKRTPNQPTHQKHPILSSEVANVAVAPGTTALASP